MSRCIDSGRDKSRIYGDHSCTEELIKITLGKVIFTNKVLETKTVVARGVDFHQCAERTDCINRSATVRRRDLLNKSSPVCGSVTIRQITRNLSRIHVCHIGHRGHRCDNFEEDIRFERTTSTETEIAPIEHTSCDCVPVDSGCDFNRRGVDRHFVVEDRLQHTAIHAFCNLVHFEEFVRTDDETTSVAPADLTNFCEESRVVSARHRRCDCVDNFCDNCFEVASNGFILRDLRILHASKTFLFEFCFETSAFECIFNDCFVLESEVLFRGFRFCFITSLCAFDDAVDNRIEAVILCIKIEMFHHCCSPPLIKVQRLRKDRVCHLRIDRS